MDSLNFSRIRGEDQNVFFNTTKILGIQDLSINSNFGADTMRYLGIWNKREYLVPNSEQYADVTISRLMLKEQTYDFGLTTPFNMFILQNEKDINTSYSLIGGYHTSYSIRCSAGTIPQETVSYRFYTDAGKIPSNRLTAGALTNLNNIVATDYSLLNTGIPLTPHSDSISLTIDEFNTQRIQELSMDIQFPRVPIYNIGSKTPVRVDSIYPLNIDLNVTFEISASHSGIQLRSFPESPKEQNIVLSINDYATNAYISQFTLNNMTLLNETQNSTPDGNVTVSRSYKEYLGEG